MGNYREGTDRPLQILDLFFKSPEAISGPGDTVVLPPHQANIFHHEGEIAVVIGREAKDLTRRRGDGRGLRLRRLQRHLGPRSGARPGSTASSASRSTPSPLFGPWIVTKDEIPDPQSAARHGRRQRRTPPGLLDERHGAPGSGAADLHLIGDDAAPRRRHLLRHEPPGARLGAGWRRGGDHGLRHRVVRASTCRTSTSGRGSAASTARRGSG